MKLFRFLGNLNKERGTATLINLMTMGLVVSFTAGGVAAGTGTIINSAKNVQKTANLRQIATALELYYLDNLSYPAISEKGNKGFSEAAENLVKGGYINFVPQDGEDYEYFSQKNGQGYVLRVFMGSREEKESRESETMSEEEINCGGPFYCQRM